MQKTNEEKRFPPNPFIFSLLVLASMRIMVLKTGDSQMIICFIFLIDGWSSKGLDDVYDCGLDSGTWGRPGCGFSVLEKMLVDKHWNMISGTA